MPALRCPDKSGQRLLGCPRPFVVEMLLRKDCRRHVAQSAVAALATNFWSSRFFATGSVCLESVVLTR